MTSGPLRTQPIARSSWIIEVVFNDPPPPPPNNVPPLKEDNNANLTIREQFAAYRENPSCAGCHAKIDPLGFALENFDITGRWCDKHENGRLIDASGTLVCKHNFANPSDFKAVIASEKHRFARAFVSHLLRFALSRELNPRDKIAIDTILEKTAGDDFRLQLLIRQTVMSEGNSPGIDEPAGSPTDGGGDYDGYARHLPLLLFHHSTSCDTLLSGSDYLSWESRPSPPLPRLRSSIK